MQAIQSMDPKQASSCKGLTAAGRVFRTSTTGTQLRSSDWVQSTRARGHACWGQHTAAKAIRNRSSQAILSSLRLAAAMHAAIRHPYPYTYTYTPSPKPTLAAPEILK